MIKALKEIPVSHRTEGMVDASADYYQESQIFHAIQNTQALEYDRIDEQNTDLAAQLSPLTATWGLIYWEMAVGLIPRPLDDYERRRPPILARLINEENFSAEMIYKIAEGFGANIRVYIDSAACLVDVIFQRGVPAYLEEFNDALKNIVHAHLGVEYFFEYHIEGGLRIETSYKRYVYMLPVASPSLFCGVWPTSATLGRSYKSDLFADSDYHTAYNEYKKSGLYASGPRPFIAVDGRIYPATIGTDVGLRNRDQHYALSGVTESGTYPSKTTEGRMYSTDVAAHATSEDTQQSYALAGTTNSGTQPTKAVEGRVYSAEVSTDFESSDVVNTYKLCDQIYSGGEPIV